MQRNYSSGNRRRRRRGDPDQLILPLSGYTPPDVIALRTIAWESTGMPRYAWRQCRELAIAIVLCGVRDGCRASVGKLIEVANQNAPDAEPVIGSRRTFHRAMERLFALGLVCSDRQSNKNGNPAALRWILPDRLAQLVEESRKLAQQNREFPEENDFRGTHLAHTWHTPGTNRPYYSTSSTSSTNKTQPRAQRARRDAQICNWDAEEIERVRTIARRLTHPTNNLLPRATEPRDRELLCKVIHLAGRACSEHSLYDAIEALRLRYETPKNPWAFFKSVLADKLALEGKYLNRELARIVVPPELLERPARDPVDPLAERLCHD